MEYASFGSARNGDPFDHLGALAQEEAQEAVAPPPREGRQQELYQLYRKARERSRYSIPHFLFYVRNSNVRGARAMLPDIFPLFYHMVCACAEYPHYHARNAVFRRLSSLLPPQWYPPHERYGCALTSLYFLLDSYITGNPPSSLWRYVSGGLPRKYAATLQGTIPRFSEGSVERVSCDDYSQWEIPTAVGEYIAYAKKYGVTALSRQFPITRRENIYRAFTRAEAR
jgi:hypothetical protein